MSAVVAEPPAVAHANGKPVSPVEYVKGLSLDDKHAVFMALFEEGLREHDGRETVRIDTAEGVTLGYFLTREQYRQMRRLPPETDESLEQLGRALTDIDNTFSITEFMDECRREDAARGR